MGIIPDSLKTSDNWPYITNSFNGKVNIDSYDINGSSGWENFFGIAIEA